MRRFELNESTPHPGCRQIEVIGELDLAVAERLMEALDAALATHRRILIGLDDCDFIDSTGIAVVLQAYGRAQAKGGRAMVFGARGQVQRIIELTGLTADGLVFASAKEALAASEDVG